MARAREVEFYRNGVIVKGQLILLSPDGVDRLVAQDLEFIVIPDLKIRSDIDGASWQVRDVIANSKDADDPIPFSSRELTTKLAEIITRRANDIRASNPPKK